MVIAQRARLGASSYDHDLSFFSIYLLDYQSNKKYPYYFDQLKISDYLSVSLPSNPSRVFARSEFREDIFPDT